MISEFCLLLTGGFFYCVVGRGDIYEQVKLIREQLENNEVVILTDFQGLSVSEIGELREKLRQADVRYKVFKNRLIAVAAGDLGIEGLEPYLYGSTAIAMADNPVAIAKVLLEFGEEHENLKIKGGILDNRVIDAEMSASLVNMPSKSQLLAQVVSGLNAPIYGLIYVLKLGNPVSGLANVLSGTIRQFSNVIQAIADLKENPEET
ncbi:TPA: 50S ribosomal protein L10 [Candidatus Poribacteria bacterium]|nr:50S ribosomal protein L10 [Candidatus Poribacteria bacterium]